MTTGDNELREQAATFFRQLQALGEQFVLLPAEAPERPEEPSLNPPQQSKVLTDHFRSLEQMQRELKDCRLCLLSEGAQHFVLGEGDPAADLMFVGEAPGAEEDRLGRPFVGQSGKLLDKIIAAIGFSREEVYITNMIKCRPPDNRDPLPEEIARCEPILLTQLALIRPKVIVTLGRFSAFYFHGRQDTLKNLRGRVADFDGIKVVSTYHPAALLRNADYKRPTWEDMLLARRIYDQLGGRPSSGQVYRPVEGQPGA